MHGMKRSNLAMVLCLLTWTSTAFLSACSGDEDGATSAGGKDSGTEVGNTGGTGGGTGGTAGTGGQVDAGADAPVGPLPPPHDGGVCGFEDRGRIIQVATDIEVCAPAVVCTSETCPPDLGTCVQGQCQYEPGYAGLETLPEAWATYYCSLPGGGCHGVTQVEFAEVTAAQVSASLGIPPCYEGAPASGRCVGIMAAPPMMVGNSQEAVDPATGKMVSLWGLGMTEATGSCYEIEGPGGTAVLAVTDRCGGYCRCNGSGFQECGPCVSAPDMEPHCACVGSVPGLYDECCGMGCSTLKADCDWCASNNHPHFDLDTDAFNWVCGAEGVNGSCRLTAVRYVPCNAAKKWPPGGGSSSCPAQSFACPEGSPAPEQPQIPGTECCCNWGLTPQTDGTCG
jgi:hypothetical protein